MNVPATGSRRTDPFETARALLRRRLPEHYQRITWTPRQLRAHQTAALRDLLRAALRHSPFHAARLARHVGDVDRFEPEDLVRLPVMTKAQMMRCYDDVVTDRRLSRAVVDAFLAAAGPQPAALFDEFLVLGSGGCSGVRGVFALHMRDVPDYLASILRGALARIGGGAVPSGVRLTIVAARSSAHATRAVPPIIDGGIARVTYVPVTLDQATIVQRVQQSDPLLLVGYAGALVALAGEQLAGRLSIRPRLVVSTSEQLTPAAAARIAAAFGVAPVNSFGSSEGLNGAAPPGEPAFTFSGDAALVEFVDADELPVPVGTPCHHVLVTNLLNTAQPLIRYRLDDAMTQQPPLDGIGHVRATVQGRSDELLRLDGGQVHPHAVRSVLVRAAEVVEYQVRAGGRRLQADLVADGPVDTVRIARDIEGALAAAGVPGVDVQVGVVAAVERDPHTGKARRFAPLARPAAATAEPSSGGG
jgi:phenylacetate-CoA ligase